MCVGFFNYFLWNALCVPAKRKPAIRSESQAPDAGHARVSGSDTDSSNMLRRRSRPSRAELLSRRSSLSRRIALEFSCAGSSNGTPMSSRKNSKRRISDSLSTSQTTTTVEEFLAGEFQSSCLREIRHELGYQGKQLARIVRDIHLNHEAAFGGDDNIAVQGLEMVLSEIRYLRNELNGHKRELAELRNDINQLLRAENHDGDEK